MKTKLSIIFGFICVSVTGQEVKHTYLDAVKLAKMYAVQDKVEVYNKSEFTAILKNYGIDNNQKNPILKFHEIDIFLMKPPSAMIAEGNKTNNNTTGSRLEIINSLQTSELSGLSWQSAVINGTATFMAERFKAEMANTVLQNIFDKIQTKDYENIRILFPNTLSQIKRFYPNEKGKVNSYYSSDLGFLRQVIINDINALPKNITESETLRNKMPTNSSDFLVLGYHIMNYTKQEYPITSIIEKASKIDYNDKSIKEITALCYVLSEALRDSKESNAEWVNPAIYLNYNPKKSKDVKDLTATFFYALLYEQLKVYMLVELLSDDPIEFTSSTQSILSNFNSFNSAYEFVKANKLKKGDIDDYINYTTQIISTFTDIIEHDLIRAAYKIDIKNIEFINKSVNIYKPIAKQEYEKVIPVVLIEIEEYFPQDMNIENMRSINFLSQLGVAETSQDIENILESFALPIGSASIKRGSNFNVSLNGYVGITAGRETAYSDIANQTKWNVGLAAPIGISATMNKFTLFASIIDLGTIVNVRLGGDNSSYSGLKFEHFLSPGLGLYYNIPKAPISFGFHYSYIPNLRTIKFEENSTTTITETNTSVGRINFSILIDIPFLTIYNK